MDASSVELWGVGPAQSVSEKRPGGQGDHQHECERREGRAHGGMEGHLGGGSQELRSNVQSHQEDVLRATGRSR